jgi:MraZ protein
MARSSKKSTLHDNATLVRPKPESTSNNIQEAQNRENQTGFLGVFIHSIDEKGRLSCPSEFRQLLNGESIVLTNFISDGARCLEGFSIQSWKEFTELLRRKSRFDSKLHKLENFYLSRAHQCTLDTSGRVIVPAHLKTYAALEKEVVFSSSIHGFRLWDKRVWELVFREAESALLDNPNLFEGIDLESKHKGGA